MSSERVLINIRVKPQARDAMLELAEKCDLTLSDIARMAMAKGLPILKQELKA